MIKTRYVSLALAAAAAGFGATPADANFVGEVVEGTASVQLRGTDQKTYQVGYTLNGIFPASGSASYTLDIVIARCTEGSCGAQPRRYTLQLSNSQVTHNADRSSFTVSAKTLGTSLQLSWTSLGDATVAPPGIRVIAGPVDFQLEANGGDTEAEVRATAWGAACSVTGGLESSHVIAPQGYAAPGGQTPPSSAPPQFAKRAKRSVGCLA